MDESERNILLQLVEKLTLGNCIQLVRTVGLSDVTIDDIKHDYIQDTREQKYQLLKQCVKVHGKTVFEKLTSEVEKQSKGKCYGVDLLSMQYVDRPEEIEALLGLLKGGGSNLIGIVDDKGSARQDLEHGGDQYMHRPDPIGIRGFGGIGKTTIAKALAQKVCEKMEMDVAFLTISQNSDILRSFNVLHYYLEGKRENFPDIRAGQDWLRKETEGRHLLLILDDVWNEKDVMPFNVLGPNCRLLITTRHEYVLTYNKAKIHPLGTLNADQSNSMLLKYADVTSAEITKYHLGKTFGDIQSILKNLPLAIAVIGSALRQSNKSGDFSCRWERILKKLRSRNNHWKKQLTTESYSHSLYGAFDVSFEFLGGVEMKERGDKCSYLQSRILDFALFAEDTEIRAGVLLKLWGQDKERQDTEFLDDGDDIDDVDLQDNLDKMTDSSLINSSAVRDNGEQCYTLHDLVVHYMVYKYEEVHGKGSLQRRHRDLLSCYLPKVHDDEEVELLSPNENHTPITGNREKECNRNGLSNKDGEQTIPWWQIDNDGYIYLYLFHHLMNAGYEQEANKLLLKYKWIKKKLQETEVAAVIADFEHYLCKIRMKKTSKTESPSDNIVNESIKMIYQSLNFTARIITRESHQLPVQLLGSLIQVPNPEISKFIKDIECEKALAMKHALVPITPCLTQPGGYLKRSIPDNKATVLCVAFTNDNKRIIAGLGTGGYKKARVLIIDRETGRESILGKEVDRHDGLVFGLAIHPKDYFVITASFDKTLKVWPLDNVFEEVSVLTGHTDDIYCVALSSDGCFAVSGSADETIKKWDLEDKTCCLSMPGHNGTVRQVCITKNGDRAVSGSEDGKVRIWCLTTGNMLTEYGSMVGSIRQIAITHDDSRVVTVGLSEDAVILNLDNGTLVRTLTGHGREIICCAITNNDSHVFTGAVDGIIRMWPLEGEGEERIFQGHAQRVRYIGISKDGNTMASGSEDCSLKVWDCNPISTKHITSQQGHIAATSALAVTADGSMVLSASHDNTLQLWDVATYEMLHVFRGHRDKINCVTLSETLSYGISGSSDKRIGIWDLKKRINHHYLPGHEYEVTSVTSANLHGRNIIISGSIDNVLLVWDINKLAAVHKLTSDFYDVKHIRMTSENQVSAIFQESASVWNITDKMLADGDASLSLNDCCCTHSIASAISSCQQSWPIIGRSDKNGFIVGWDEMSRIRKWDLDNEIEAKVSSGHGDANLVTCLCLTDDNEILLCGSESGHVNLIGLHNTDQPIGQLKKPPSTENSPVTAISSIETQQNREGPITILIFTAHKNGKITCYSIDKAKLYCCGCVSVTECDGNIPPDDGPDVKQPLMVDPMQHIGSLSSAVTHLIAYTAQGAVKLLSCSDSPNNPSIIIWDVANQCEEMKLAGHTDRVTSICMVGDTHAISGSRDGTVRYWNLETGACRVDRSDYSDIRSLCVTRDAKQYLVSTNKNLITVHETTSGNCIRTIALGSKFNMKYLSLSRDGSQLLCCYDDFSSEVRSLETDDVTLSMIGHQNEWGNIAYVSDDKTVFSRSSHCGMKVWSATTGEVLGYIGRGLVNDKENGVTTAVGHSRMVTAVAVHSGNFVLTGSYDKTIKLWTIEQSRDGKLRFSLVNTYYFEHAVTTIAMCKDNVICVGLLSGLVCFLRLNID